MAVVLVVVGQAVLHAERPAARIILAKIVIIFFIVVA
jgi:hypothetical protein